MAMKMNGMIIRECKIQRSKKKSKENRRPMRRVERKDTGSFLSQRNGRSYKEVVVAGDKKPTGDRQA